MKKLIELLNEYSKNIGYFNKEDLQGQTKAWILSKEFGFIKRLVENDKIDRHKFYDKNILKGFMTLTKGEKIDSIIMNLSISDTPIDLLCSLLK